jgi:hypothetical protein
MGLAAATVAAVDGAAALDHPLADVILGADVAAGSFAAIAVHVVLAALAVPVLALFSVARERLHRPLVRGAATLVPTVVLAIAVLALNRELLDRRPWPTWLLLAALPLVHGAVVLALAREGSHRRVLLAIGGATTLAALAVNGWMFRGVSAPQHQSLVAAAWAFAVPTAWMLVRPIVAATARVRRQVLKLLALAWTAAFVFVVQADATLRDAPAGARLVVRELAPSAAATLAGLGPLFEVDGDGEPGWPVGGDCAALDGAVSPASPEIPGDGVDQNCLAGDPDAAAVEELARQLGGATEAAPRSPAASRILLVTIDALRFDAALPASAERLAGRCTEVARAYSTNSETTYAAYSLFASRFPSQGRFSEVGAFHVPVHDPAPRLPALLGAAGFATGAIAFHNRFDPRLALTAGFAEVWTAEARPEVIFAEAGTVATDRAIAWLRGREPPYFLWVHYYDPHEPYIAHEDVPFARDTPRSAYAGEVAHTDRQIVRLLDALGPALDDVALVLTADHGEAFGEHGRSFHGTDLFDEQIRVPLWVCPPRGWSLPADIDLASLVDVAPTLLDFAGVARPPSFVGRSLLRAATGAPAFAEIIRGARMQAAIVGHHKLVRYVEGDILLLFDLARDPGERADLVGVDDATQRELERALDTWAGLVAR